MANAAFKITKDDVSPLLSAMAHMARHPRPVFLAMGTAFKSLTEGNFNSNGSGFRPAPWPPKKDGSPATLKKSGLLWHSFRLAVSDAGATLSNPTPYAAIHQFGSGQMKARRKTKHGEIEVQMNIPARPFVPVGPDGRLTRDAFLFIRDAGYRAIQKM